MERLAESRDALHKLLNEPILASTEEGGCSIFALVYNNKPSDAQDKQGEQKRTTDPYQYVECAYGAEQLDKFFGLQKIKSSFQFCTSFPPINVGEKHQCEKVFQWVANKIQIQEK